MDRDVLLGLDANALLHRIDRYVQTTRNVNKAGILGCLAGPDTTLCYGTGIFEGLAASVCHLLYESAVDREGRLVDPTLELRREGHQRIHHVGRAAKVDRIDGDAKLAHGARQVGDGQDDADGAGDGCRVCNDCVACHGDVVSTRCCNITH